jgi:hypothetical protein
MIDIIRHQNKVKVPINDVKLTPTEVIRPSSMTLKKMTPTMNHQEIFTLTLQTISHIDHRQRIQHEIGNDQQERNKIY